MVALVMMIERPSDSYIHPYRSLYSLYTHTFHSRISRVRRNSLAQSFAMKEGNVMPSHPSIHSFIALILILVCVCHIIKPMTPVMESNEFKARKKI